MLAFALLPFPPAPSLSYPPRCCRCWYAMKQSNIFICAAFSIIICWRLPGVAALAEYKFRAKQRAVNIHLCFVVLAVLWEVCIGIARWCSIQIAMITVSQCLLNIVSSCPSECRPCAVSCCGTSRSICGMWQSEDMLFPYCVAISMADRCL